MIVKALALASVALASCAPANPPAPGPQTRGHAPMQQLSPAEIRTALSGKRVSYAPPGSADAGVEEEYHSDGRWGGTVFGRGPIPFSGHWKVENGLVCVQAEEGRVGRLGADWICRALWRDGASGSLLMDHLTAPSDPQRLSVRALAG